MTLCQLSLDNRSRRQANLMDKLKCTVTLLDLGVTDEVLFVLDQHASLDFFVVLAH